jgi:hypothetical protein
LGVAAQAADVPYTILLDGRPLTPKAAGTGAVARDGVVFVDVIVATKTFSGLLTLADAGNTVRLSIQNHEAVFRVGSKIAQFDGKRRVLPGAPFKLSGDIYIPLLTVSRLGGGVLTIDTKRQIARLSVRPFATMHFTPVPAVTAVTPSAAVLTLTPSSTVDAKGALHVKLDVANSSNVPVSLEFPNGGRVAFVVSRDGTSVWDSTRGFVFNMIVGFVTVAPKESLSFDGVWPGYGALPPGNYQLTARLLTRSPLVSPAVAVPAPHPAAT